MNLSETLRVGSAFLITESSFYLFKVRVTVVFLSEYYAKLKTKADEKKEISTKLSCLSFFILTSSALLKLSQDEDKKISLKCLAFCF